MPKLKTGNNQRVLCHDCQKQYRSQKELEEHACLFTYEPGRPNNGNIDSLWGHPFIVTTITCIWYPFSGFQFFGLFGLKCTAYLPGHENLTLQYVYYATGLFFGYTIGELTILTVLETLWPALCVYWRKFISVVLSMIRIFFSCDSTG